MIRLSAKGIQSAASFPEILTRKWAAGAGEAIQRGIQFGRCKSQGAVARERRTAATAAESVPLCMALGTPYCLPGHFRCGKDS